MREKLRAVVRESTFHKNVIMQPVLGFLSPLRIFKNSELTPENSSIKKKTSKEHCCFLLYLVYGKHCKH